MDKKILKQPLLSIVIPTYNRAKYLERNLSYLNKQLNNKYLPVEIIVSDNNSDDETLPVIDKYLGSGLEIKYFKNFVNMGPDYNIAQCYLKSSGKYVVALSDDDVLVDNAIEKILAVLRNKEYGVVYLNHKIIGDTVDCNINNGIRQVKIIEFTDTIAFLNQINYYITFISGNIVNRSYLDEEKLMENLNTNLVQVPFILNAILSASRNAFITDKVLAVQADNTGGYDLFSVFGKNLNLVMKSVLNEKDKRKEVSIIRLINNELLVTFFPYWIYKLRCQNNGFLKSDPIEELRNDFKKYFNFWFLNYPIAKFPLNMSKFFCRVIGQYSVVRRRVKYLTTIRRESKISVSF